MPGKRSDADKAHRFRGRKARADPGEELNQIQLIEKVVLEPKDQLIVRLVTPNRFSPQSQIVDRIDVGFRSRSSEISGTNVEQFRVSETARNRPFIKGIGPEGSRARNTSGFDQAGCRGAVRHVQVA